MTAATSAAPLYATTPTPTKDGLIPLASPMHWDPHAGQISFASLAALACSPSSAPAPLLQPAPASEPLFLGLDLSTQVGLCLINFGLIS